MAGNIGWASVQGSNIIGSENGIVVKVSGHQLSASGDVVWDATAKTLTIAGASASSTTLSITGKIVASELSAPTITAATELYVGAHSRTLSDVGQITGNGNSLTISGTQVVPADFRSQLYGPISVTADANLIVGAGAVIAVRADAELPSVLQP